MHEQTVGTRLHNASTTFLS